MTNLFVSVLHAGLVIITASKYEYDLVCPHKSHWVLRATTQRCENKTVYHCLFDINSNNFTEECFIADDYPSGYHGVLSGKLHAATCTDGYFAPKVTWTHDGFTCSYQKSVCNEEGQIVVNNGSNKDDIKCRCDYNKGYGFIYNPQNNCTCSPWTEDCSCHRIHCINSRFILSEDYTCVPKDNVPSDQKCKKIPLHRETLPNKDSFVMTGQFSSPDVKIGKVAFLSILVAVGLLISIGTYVGLNLWYVSKRRKSKMAEIKFYWKTVNGLSKFKELRATLKKKSILVLKGRHGTGKTTIAKCLQLSFCEDRCRIIHIREKELNEFGQKPSYIITDSNGKEKSFDNAIISSLIGIMKTKLIIFVIDYETPDSLRDIVTDPDEVIYDLNGKEFYTTEDKKNILTLQMNKSNVFVADDANMCQSTADSETKIINKSLFTNLPKENPYLGFPLMCASICSHKDHLHLGMQYFRQPPDELVSKLDKLRNEGTSDECCALQYCLLVSLLLFSLDKKTSLDDIIEKSFSKIMQTIYPDKWLPYQKERAQDMASCLMPKYIITECNSSVKFSHCTIYLAVMISLGRNHPLIVLRECEVRDIMYFIRPNNYKQLEDEIVLRAHYLDDTFVMRLTEFIMSESVYVEEITKQLTYFTVTYKETDLLLKVVKVIQNDKEFSFPSRLTFFTHVAVCAHAFSTSCLSELRAYILAWEYVVYKTDEIEDNLGNLTKQVLKYDSIENILLTTIDQHENTLLHYFVIWGGYAEKSIISSISNFEKGLIKEEDIARLCKSSKLQNKTKHTPLHFAAFFGRYDLFTNLIKIIKCRNARSIFTFKSENTTLESLIKSGRCYVSKSVKEHNTDNIERKVLFESWLMPLGTSIKFGESYDYDEIKAFMDKSV